MNRYQEACEMIWGHLKEIKADMAQGDYAPSIYLAFFGPIEQILTFTESRIEDDMEAHHQAYLEDEKKKSNHKPYFHV